MTTIPTTTRDAESLRSLRDAVREALATLALFAAQWTVGPDDDYARGTVAAYKQAVSTLEQNVAGLL